MEFPLVQYHKDDQPFIGPGSQDMEPGKKGKINYASAKKCVQCETNSVHFLDSIFITFHLMKSKLISEN